MSAWAFEHPYLSFFVVLGLIQLARTIICHVLGRGDCDD